MMFGSGPKGINAYVNVGIETGVVAANPNKLIVMLYEGAIQACYSSIVHMQNKDIAKKGAMISQAIMIIESGLRASLNKNEGGEIAQSLDALYIYMSDRLFTANLKNRIEPIQEVIRLLADLKGAWETIDKKNVTANATENKFVETRLRA